MAGFSFFFFLPKIRGDPGPSSPSPRSATDNKYTLLVELHVVLGQLSGVYVRQLAYI